MHPRLSQGHRKLIDFALSHCHDGRPCAGVG